MDAWWTVFSTTFALVFVAELDSSSRRRIPSPLARLALLGSLAAGDSLPSAQERQADVRERARRRGKTESPEDA